MENKNLVSFTKMAVITAIYVVVTYILAPISFGAFQLRLSESFNHLVMYNKRYIFSVTAGVAIANLFFSPLGVIDMAIGGSATLGMLLISYFITKKIANPKTRIVINTIICSTIGMLPIALMLYYFTDWAAPFFTIYIAVAIGQVISMTLGGIIIYLVGTRVDLTQ